MKGIYRTAIVAGALAAAGCSSLPGANLGDTFFIQSYLETELSSDGSYVSEQAIAYQERAAYEASFGEDGDSNWYDATAFYRKSLAAHGGEEVQPWNPSELGVNGDLQTGFDRTVDAAAQYKDIRPRECAQMVAFYDHWLEQAREDDHSVTPVGVVQGEWSNARIECIGGLGVVSGGSDARWVVYFGFDRSNLDAEARSVVNDVIAAVSGTASRLELTGHTDTVGSTAYNQGLSVRRARSVARALVAGGVPSDNLSLGGRSELELAVPTPDGVREPLNRRVEIDRF